MIRHCCIEAAKGVAIAFRLVPILVYKREYLSQYLFLHPNYFQTLLQVAATDADESNFGTITYSIVDGSHGMFTIDNQTGWINTTSQLDREDKDNYVIIVRATDGKTLWVNPSWIIRKTSLEPIEPSV